MFSILTAPSAAVVSGLASVFAELPTLPHHLQRTARNRHREAEEPSARPRTPELPLAPPPGEERRSDRGACPPLLRLLLLRQSLPTRRAVIPVSSRHPDRAGRLNLREGGNVQRSTSNIQRRTPEFSRHASQLTFGVQRWDGPRLCGLAQNASPTTILDMNYASRILVGLGGVALLLVGPLPGQPPARARLPPHHPRVRTHPRVPLRRPAAGL